MHIDQARAAVLTWRELSRMGITREMLRTELKSGRLRRVDRGSYIACAIWTAQYAEGRHLVRVAAAILRLGADVVFSHLSAAALHDLPFYRFEPPRLHISRPSANGQVTRCEPLVARHELTVPDADVVTIGGIRCTSLVRTVADCIRMVSQEAGIAIADAALRQVAWDDKTRTYDEAAARRFKAEVMVRLPKGGRGVRQARYLLDLADGRAQRPGESVSRLYLVQLGFERLLLQVKVRGPKGKSFSLDLGLADQKAFGEFDGKGKYLDDELRGDMDAEAVVLAEKEREDWIRGVTGWRVVRWGWDDIATIDRFHQKLQAFGLRPPT